MLCFSPSEQNQVKIRLAEGNGGYDVEMSNFQDLQNFCINSGDRFNIGISIRSIEFFLMNTRVLYRSL